MTGRDAGRELDALVAERVMGYGHSECRAAEEDVWISDDGMLWLQLPAYSTAIWAAWDVLAKMRSRFSLWRTFTDELQAAVSTGLRPGEWVSHDFVWRLVQPEHICRAALKAVGA